MSINLVLSGIIFDKLSSFGPAIKYSISLVCGFSNNSFASIFLISVANFSSLLSLKYNMILLI